MPDVVVVGQVGRDLVLRVPGLPPAGGSATAVERHELLGGKGANQAVALAQLGLPVALVGVVGGDRAGEEVLAQAAADGVDVSAVRRREGVPTALLLDLVEDGGARRLVESVSDELLLTATGVAVAALLVDRQLAGVEAVRGAAAELLAAGPRLVSLAAGEDGDLVAWRGSLARGRRRLGGGRPALGRRRGAGAAPWAAGGGPDRRGDASVAAGVQREHRPARELAAKVRSDPEEGAR